MKQIVVRARGRVRAQGEAGQATAEYALVLLGAALVALMLIAWATAGGGAGKIGQLLDHVLQVITSKVG
jgi:Flp pilus assembly pilin Flp